ncbi:MAG TPA: 6-phospho-beta-glucosidase [Chloroflexi bacterium]|nr:6-phospho-beta-glucosidase [Chloroflexota bacterium]
MAKIAKVAVIGGGSSYTPELIDGFITHEEEVQVGEIALHDIDPERLEIVGGMVQRQVHFAELDTKITLTGSRQEAVEGADFVVSQIRVGQMAARILDEKIPLKYDVIGQETTGPGGTLKAWRTIPVALEIARDVERYAPGAWFLNFTNPSGIITEALLKHSNVNVVGLCNNPINMQHMIAEALGVRDEQIFLEWVGLNHVNWVRRVYLDGQDITGRMIDLLEMAGDEFPFDPELARTLGVIPTWYLQYYYDHPHKVAEAKAAEKTRGEVVREIEKALFEKYRDPNQMVKPPELSQRGGALYSEAAIRLMLSLLLDRRDVQIVVTRNGGAIADLPEDVSVEVPCVVGAHGVIPLNMGHLPETIRALCQQVKSWESWTVEAGVTGSRRAALMAMLVNPLVPSFEVARALLDEMLEAHRAYLPQFFPSGTPSPE